MESSKPKTISDFPKFTVTGIRRGETSETGFTRFELDGSFENLVGLPAPHWFWLLYGYRDCISASLKSIDKDTKAVVLTCHEEDEPQLVGQTLAYLSPYWQAFHVWMVSDLRWVWERMEFTGIDAVAEDYESKDVSIVGGQEVRVWTKIEPLASRGAQSRYYPADDQTLPARPGTRTIPSAWNHEHCELCRAHIDAGEFGYRDLGDRWLCEGCYERYVARHDLAFVDDL